MKVKVKATYSPFLHPIKWWKERKQRRIIQSLAQSVSDEDMMRYIKEFVLYGKVFIDAEEIIKK